MIAILGIIYCFGAYLVFIKFRLLKFNVFWQIVVGLVGFFGLLTILYGMHYTQPFSIGTTVSGLTTQIEARVPGKVIEVDVRDNTSVKKGDVLFRMDPQPYSDDLQKATAVYAAAQPQTARVEVTTLGL
jgi:multidrug resistance efflux pump